MICKNIFYLLGFVTWQGGKKKSQPYQPFNRKTKVAENTYQMSRWTPYVKDIMEVSDNYHHGNHSFESPLNRVIRFLTHLSWKLKWAFLIAFRPVSVCLSVCPSVCKLFLFSTSSQEPLGQFQPNLVQSILEWMGFNFVQRRTILFS